MRSTSTRATGTAAMGAISSPRPYADSPRRASAVRHFGSWNPTRVLAASTSRRGGPPTERRRRSNVVTSHSTRSGTDRHRFRERPPVELERPLRERGLQQYLVAALVRDVELRADARQMNAQRVGRNRETRRERGPVEAL